MSEASTLMSRAPFSFGPVDPAVRELSARTCRAHADSSLTLNEIHLLAFRKWLAAGKPRGDGAQFWIKAEMELQGRPSC
jgi:hypothetical protein